MSVYDTDGYRKHKRPEGWGSLCPPHITTEQAQNLLETGVTVGRQVYNVDGEWAFCAQNHVADRWHGYPIPWSRLPSEAVEALLERGQLDRKTYRKAIRKLFGEAKR